MRLARFHCAWVVATVTFLALLVTSSVRVALAADLGGYVRMISGDRDLLLVSATLVGFIATGLALRLRAPARASTATATV